MLSWIVARERNDWHAERQALARIADRQDDPDPSSAGYKRALDHLHYDIRARKLADAQNMHWRHPLVRERLDRDDEEARRPPPPHPDHEAPVPHHALAHAPNAHAPAMPPPSADDRELEPPASQASQPGANALPIPDEMVCAVCLELMLEPATTPCNHSFCRTCILQVGEQSMHCPLCRAALPPHYIAPVDEVFRARLEAECGPQLASRRRQFERADRRARAHGGTAAAEAAAAIVARRQRAERNDELRRLMWAQRAALQAATPGYFELLERELSHPDEPFRCECAARLVCLRRRRRVSNAGQVGREYVSCPLFRPGQPTRSGCGFFQNVL